MHCCDIVDVAHPALCFILQDRAPGPAFQPRAPDDQNLDRMLGEMQARGARSASLILMTPCCAGCSPRLMPLPGHSGKLVHAALHLLPWLACRTRGSEVTCTAGRS